MLFQPTNVTPSVLGGAENGTINASSGITISWQVNGNSPIVAYRLAILQNDAESTSLYNTGIVNLSTPIYPTNYKGEPQRCSCTIDAATLSASGITNGNEYKITIRQFWDANNLDASHSVRTSSSLVFLTRANAHVSIITPSVGTVLATTAQTFTAQYWQGVSYDATRIYDPIEWVRWQVYDSADRGRTIYDSEKIYTQELKLDYDGLLNGRTYVITLTVHNSVGQTATVSEQYDVSWSAQITKDVAVATRLNNQSSAVKVSWNGFTYIPADVTGASSVIRRNGALEINSPNSSVTYQTLNGSAMTLSTPWALAMGTVIKPTSSLPIVNILTVTMANGTTHEISYSKTNRTLSITGANGTTVTGDLYVDEADGRMLKIFIDEAQVIVYRYEAEVGITPSNTLTPSNDLVPTMTESQSMMSVANLSLSGTTQSAITSITMGGRQIVDFIEVVSDVTAEQRLYMHQDWAADYDNDGYTAISEYSNISLLADYSESLDAGNYSIGGIRITGWDVYRKRKSEAFARHLASLELFQLSFLDYGCGSQMGKYTYFIYPRAGNMTHITSAMQSNTIQPVFWNWSIVEASYDEDTNVYTVLNEYVFRHNVSSGSISNNNSPTVSQNFTQYPTVQMATANYQSGTLQGLIGQVGFTSYVVQYGNSLVDLEERFGVTEESILENNNLAVWENHGYTGMVIKLFNPNGLVEYRDDIDQRNALWALSTTQNHLFLKSRKGDIMEIRIAGEISMSTMDNTPQQAITASVPWVQVADAYDKSLITPL